MKKMIFLYVMIIVAIIVTGCSHKNEQFKLRIKESSWSGWTENYEPEEVTNKYDIVLGEQYSTSSGGLTFVVTEIGHDFIVIQTTESFSDSESGINLNSKKKEFTIYLNKEKVLTTPTMDAGEVYSLTLIK